MKLEKQYRYKSDHDLKPIKESELTAIFKQIYNYLYAGGELNSSKAFDEFDKLLFCKLMDEQQSRNIGDLYDFQDFSDDNKLLDKITNLYNIGKNKYPEIFKDNIDLPILKIKTIVTYLQGVSLSETDLDSKGRAFETFMGNFFRGDFGQYFTPRPIVKFIVDILPIKKDSKLLDTSCGSGGFLLYSLNKTSNIYGIEINEQVSRVGEHPHPLEGDGGSCATIAKS